MATIKGTIEVNTARCKGCGVCVAACPADVLELSSQVNLKGYSYCIMARADKCIGCAGCALVCPDACITVFRQKIPQQ